MLAHQVITDYRATDGREISQQAVEEHKLQMARVGITFIGQLVIEGEHISQDLRGFATEYTVLEYEGEFLLFYEGEDNGHGYVDDEYGRRMYPTAKRLWEQCFIKPFPTFESANFFWKEWTRKIIEGQPS